MRATVKAEQLFLRRLLIRLTWDAASRMYNHPDSTPSVRNLVKESHWNATHRKQLQLPRARLAVTAELHGATSRTHMSESNHLSENRAVLPGGLAFYSAHICLSCPGFQETTVAYQEGNP